MIIGNDDNDFHDDDDNDFHDDDDNDFYDPAIGHMGKDPDTW